jgi:cytochrome c oxidase subunit 2
MRHRGRGAACLLLAGLLGLAGCTSDRPRSLEATGEVLSRQKGCVSCHTTDGKPGVGPTWKGLAGSQVVLDDGTTITADDGYLEESILHPSRRTVKGYTTGQMETVVKENSLNDDQVEALIAYIKTLK